LIGNTDRSIPNFEPESLILSFGENVMVLDLPWLAGKIAGQMTSAKEIYGINT
jgi:hypothetical protein